MCQRKLFRVVIDIGNAARQQTIWMRAYHCCQPAANIVVADALEITFETVNVGVFVHDESSGGETCPRDIRTNSARQGKDC